MAAVAESKGYGRVHQLVLRLAEALGAERVGQALTDELPQVLGTPHLLVAAPYHDGWRVVAAGGDLNGQEAPSFAVESALRREAATGEVAGRIVTSVPLVLRNRPRGLLLYAQPARGLDEDVVTATSLQCALALDRALLHDEETAQRAELEDSEARFRSLVHELDAIFWECDPKTFQFSFISKRAETLLGYPAADWLKPGFWAGAVHPDDRHWAVNFCVECTQEGRDHAFEYRMLAADGSTRWFRDVVYVIRDATGRATKLRGVMIEIPERKAATSRVARRIDRRRVGA